MLVPTNWSFITLTEYLTIMQLFLCFIPTIFNLMNGLDSARILGVFPSTGYSQFILADKLMRELVKRGHEVTVVSYFGPNEETENYRTILTDGKTGTEEVILFDWANSNIFSAVTIFHNFCCTLTEFLLSHERVQKLLRSNETFDLVIVEQFGNEAHMGFASHFNAPLVTFSSIGLSEWNYHLVGNVKLPSTVPLSFSTYSSHMSFIQRVINTMAHIFDVVYKELIYYPRQQAMLTKYFDKEMNLREIMFNTSFMLMNSHIVSTEPVQLTGAVAEIGGFHIASGELTPKLKEFLDGATNGTILFSLGSNLKSKDLPNETLNGIVKVFSKIPERIIWKYEDTDIPNKPSNLMILKWLPQSEILAHTNTIAFITHGGILSTTEAIYHGVPMIGIPILGDQHMNIARAVRKRIAIHLPFKEISEEMLHRAIRTVTDNQEFRSNARKYSKIFRDRVTEPLDLAMYWIEYVLRYKGGTHLRHASMDLYWFQFYTLDVWMFVISWLLLLYVFLRA